MKYYSVTFTHKYEGAADYQPRTAVFSTREKAETFMAEVMGMHDERDQDYLIATLDSGFIDGEEYLDLYDHEMCVEG